MVRILKVKALDEQKRHLLARSEMYRQTLTLEMANIKFSAALLKRKLKAPKAILALAGLAALPAAGFIYGRGQMKTKAPGREPRGLLPALMMGWNMFRKVAPVVQKLRYRRSAAASRNGRHLAHHRA